MSNLCMPVVNLAWMRKWMPRAWQEIQDQIEAILTSDTALAKAMKDSLGREGALEAMETSLDAGTAKFVPCLDSDKAFHLAFFCFDDDRYHLVTPGSPIPFPQGFRFCLPREDAEKLPFYLLPEDEDE